MLTPPNLEQNLDLPLLAELRELMGPDFGLLLQTYLDDSKIRLASIEQALLLQDAVLVRNSAHSLKGSSANIGARALAVTCMHLEQLAGQNDWQRAPQLLNDIREQHQTATQALRFLIDNDQELV